MRGGRLEAKKILDSDWVCLYLEVLGCMIGGIPGPGHPRSLIILREVTVSNQERLDLHHQVYAKLARFTKLREFRKISKRHVWQYECLSMTMESGVDVLKDLQNLRVVELWYLDNGIYNAEEMEWVQKNWPQVEIRFKKF
ncbi:hypothetical protein K457DRAFT_143036 [Linnemannia elongata AG-77]|uniref:Uncharacterized protein n=1 Tax=Linnemannia elongata AG-77 TaxID=1314771 RepID=A0A197JD65_9FUNG|nr:hypothetical protein K457DRAFT_143036 [Linnemannia elongata AG-77]